MLTVKKNNHFELNVGVFTREKNHTNKLLTLPLFDIGYRYQRPNGDFIFKAKVGFLRVGLDIGYLF